MESFSIKRKLAQEIRRQREKAMGGSPHKDHVLENPPKDFGIKPVGTPLKFSPKIQNFLKSFKKSLKVK